MRRDGGYPACPVVSNPSFRFIKPEALNLFLSKIFKRTKELFGHLGSALEVKRKRTLENILNGIHKELVSEDGAPHPSPLTFLPQTKKAG